MTLLPARLEPTFVPRIWGARSLAPLFPDKANLPEPIGEVWLTGNDSVFTNGLYAGRKLADAWKEMPAEWAGTRLNTKESFPLLVKFLFPEDILSVQVHPDDDYARQHEAATGWTGKTEMWYVHAARSGAEVLVGLKPEVTADSFCKAIAAGTAEQCLQRIGTQPGDVIFVPARTVHTIGPGMVLCEIQENSDLTYRVYDYNRKGPDGKPRPLHADKALAVARFGEQLGGKVQTVRVGRGTLVETYCVACRYFATEKWEFSEHIGGATSGEHFELLIPLEGSGRIEAVATKGAAVEYGPGQVWLLPAAMGAYRLEPGSRTSLLRTYVPGVGEFARRLADQRVPEAARSRIIFS